jgi:hypothetical protein
MSWLLIWKSTEADVLTRNLLFALSTTALVFCFEFGARASATIGSGQSDSTDLAIYNLTEKDLTPSLRECLAKTAFAKCLDIEVESANNPTPLVSGGSSPLTENVVGGWKDFLHSSFGAGKAFTQSSPAVGFGFSYGMLRLDPAEVLLDPNKAATDKKLGSNAVWVTHTLEIAPGLNDGALPASLGVNNSSKSYYGGIFQAGGIFRLMKRHPFDQTFTKNFWGELGEEKAIVRQALPDYIKVPTELTGSGLLPGEGLEMEGFLVIEIGLGPTYNIGTTPSIPYLGSGLFGSAGLVLSAQRGHFATTMEVQEDQLLRVTLERLNQDSEKLDAQLNAGFALGPFSFVENLMNLETGWIQSRERLLDLTFDPKYPEAQAALKQAYLGRFGAAQTLALNADQTYLGVREVAHSTLKQKTSERDLSILNYRKGSSESQSQIDTQFVNPEASDNEGSDDSSDMDSIDSHYTRTGKTRDLQIAVRNDGDQPKLGLKRSLSVKFNFKASKPTPEEQQQFLDMATLFGQNISPTPVPSEAMQGYFYMDLDVDNVQSILNRDPAQLEQDFKNAAAKMPGANLHLKEINSFASALKQAAQRQDVNEQDHQLLKILRGKGFDLYPLGVLALLVDPNHTLVLERITFDVNGASPQTTEFPVIGSLYQFPLRLEY